VVKMAEQHSKRKFEGMFIPAFILIGIGAGLLFGRPDVGALTGLGTGFVAIGLVKMLHSQKTGLSSGMVRSSSPIIIGVFFIIAGFGLVYFPAFIWPYFGALVLISAGIWLLFRAATHHEEEKPDEDE
jgi:hypothetical protein